MTQNNPYFYPFPELILSLY